MFDNIYIEVSVQLCNTNELWLIFRYPVSYCKRSTYGLGIGQGFYRYTTDRRFPHILIYFCNRSID